MNSAFWVVAAVVGPQAADQVLVALEDALYEVRYVGPGDERQVPLRGPVRDAKPPTHRPGCSRLP